MSAAPVTHLIIGPREHGVARFGTDLVEALRANGFDAPSIHAVELGSAVTPEVGGVHLQFTDRLFGGTPEDAAEAVRAVVRTAHARGAHVTATLHDLPQPSDGDRHHRRRAAYGDVAALIDGVVVNSEHERALLGEEGLTAQRVAVVPLPLDSVDAAVPPDPAGPRTVGVFGFLYPGKGHAEVIAALAGAAPDVEVLAMGAPSAGHQDLVDELLSAAARTGRRFHVTGHLPDAGLAEALRAVTVPVAPHRHVSASGSLNSWIGAGRRPLAPANRYTREIEARCPGGVLLYPDTAAGLRTGLEGALEDPATTWLPPGTRRDPSRADAARQYADLLRRWHR